MIHEQSPPTSDLVFMFLATVTPRRSRKFKKRSPDFLSARSTCELRVQKCSIPPILSLSNKSSDLPAGSYSNKANRCEFMKFDNTTITGICNCRSFGLQWPCRKVNPSSMPLAMPSDHPLLHIDWDSFPGSKLLKTFPNYGRTGRLYTGKWAGSRTYIAID